MLYQVERDPAIRAFVQTSLRSALQHDCNAHWQFELHWAGPYNMRATATTQVPVLDLFAAGYAVLARPDSEVARHNLAAP